MEEYIFGTSSDNYKKIKAFGLEEAINEFILSCIDFSEFSYKRNPLTKLRDEPLGYTKGERNVEFGKHRYYELIPVYNNKKLVKEITLTEFNTWHLKQNNLLENKNISQNQNSLQILPHGLYLLKK